MYATGKKNIKLPGEGIYVYDLILETTTVRIAGSVLGDDPSSDWRLSPDGKYAIWQEREEVGVVGGTGTFETGRFTLYSTETGKKTGEVKLPEKKWEDYQFGTSTWVNGFSLDGKKLLVCSSPYLYVIDIGTAKVLHKVKIPFTPGTNGEGFIVWP